MKKILVAVCAVLCLTSVQFFSMTGRGKARVRNVRPKLSEETVISVVVMNNTELQEKALAGACEKGLTVGKGLRNFLYEAAEGLGASYGVVAMSVGDLQQRQKNAFAALKGCES